MTSRERVLSVYPDAAISWDSGDRCALTVRGHDISARFSLVGNYGISGSPEDSAWDSAASKLPAGETASECTDVWNGDRCIKEAAHVGMHLCNGKQWASDAELEAVPEPVPPGGAAKSRSYREQLIQALRDPNEAIRYLQAAWDEGIEDFARAVSAVAEAYPAAPIAPAAQDELVKLVMRARRLMGSFLSADDQVQTYAIHAPNWLQDLVKWYEDTACPVCDGSGAVDSGGSDPSDAPIDIKCGACDGNGLKQFAERKEGEAKHG